MGIKRIRLRVFTLPLCVSIAGLIACSGELLPPEETRISESFDAVVDAIRGGGTISVSVDPDPAITGESTDIHVTGLPARKSFRLDVREHGAETTLMTFDLIQDSTGAASIALATGFPSASSYVIDILVVRKRRSGLVSETIIAVGEPSGPCTPALCSASDCGPVDDGCGGTLDCGACPDRVLEIRAGNYSACALISTGQVWCWGGGYEGQLGSGLEGHPASNSTPTAAIGLENAIELNAGDESVCATLDDRTMSCWGWNVSGSVGAGDSNILVPTPYSGIDNIVHVAPARTSTCVATGEGQVYCMGDNYFGQLGSGDNVDSPTPSIVEDVPDAIQIVGAEGHFCALHATGEISCWGWGSSGQLGNGEYPRSQTTPVKVLGIDDAVSIGAGHSHTCAIRSTGELWCWGANDSGQLGDGLFEYRATPQPVLNLTGVVEVVAGYVHTCALDSSGQVYCFGWDGNGNIGDGGGPSDPDNVWEVTTPSPVSGMHDAIQIAGENLGDFSCALRADRSVWCWGDGYGGQFGPGFDTTENYGSSYVPVHVEGLP